MDFFLLELGGEDEAEARGHRARCARAAGFLSDRVLPKRLVTRELIEPDFRLTAFHFADRGHDLVSWAADAERLVVFYGGGPEGGAAEILDAAARRPAEAVIEEMVAGEGRFGAVLVERASGRVRLFGDVVGGRALRHATGPGGRLAISSHDLGLMVSGLATAEVDETTLASMLRYNGWALGGRCLFAGVGTCAPGTVTTLAPAPGGARAAERRVLRIRPPEDGTPLADRAIGKLARRLAGQDRVRVELSAGLDSRASLAAALAVVPAAAITVYSEGPEASRDVQVARAIAARAGLRFEHGQVPAQGLDELLANWSQAVLECNGQSDISVLASRRLPPPGTELPCTVSGDGGECYRGHFYPYRVLGRLRGFPRRGSVEEILAAGVFRDVRYLPDERQEAPVHARLHEAVARLEAAGLSRTGILDMFFAQEDQGNWHQQLFRCESLGNRVSPFYSTLALRAALAGPEPMGWRNGLHHALIARHLPQALDLPVNGDASARLFRGAPGSDLALELRLLAGKLRRRINARLGRSEATLTAARHGALAAMLDAWYPEGARDFLPARPTLVDETGSVAAATAEYDNDPFLELGALRHIRICADVAALCRAAERGGVAAA